MDYLFKQLKKCHKCKDYKPFDEFYKDKSRRDGLRNRCKICVKEENKRYQKTDKYKEYLRRYKKNNEKVKTRNKKYQKTERYKEYLNKYNSTIEGKSKKMLRAFKHYHKIRTKKELILFLPKLILSLFDEGHISSEQALNFINNIGDQNIIKQIFKIKAEVLNDKRKAEQRSISAN